MLEKAPVPAAAGLAYTRWGLPRPPQTVQRIAGVFAVDHWHTPWTDGNALDEVVEKKDDTFVGALLDTAVEPAARVRVIGALGGRFRSRRSAAETLVHLLKPLLDDSDETVVVAAVDAAADAGPGAAVVADALVRIARSGLGAEQTSPEDPFTTKEMPIYPGPAATALAILIRLRDPRWRDPLLAAGMPASGPRRMGYSTPMCRNSIR